MNKRIEAMRDSLNRVLAKGRGEFEETAWKGATEALRRLNARFIQDGDALVAECRERSKAVAAEMGVEPAQELLRTEDTAVVMAGRNPECAAWVEVWVDWLERVVRDADEDVSFAAHMGIHRAEQTGYLEQMYAECVAVQTGYLGARRVWRVPGPPRGG